jgi:hypothetical protein
MTRTTLDDVIQVFRRYCRDEFNEAPVAFSGLLASGGKIRLFFPAVAPVQPDAPPLREVEQEVLAGIRQHGPLTLKSLAVKLNRSHNSYFRGAVAAMRDHGLIVYRCGAYQLPNEPEAQT